MHHVTVALNDQQVPHFYTAASGDTANVVADEIDEHQVLSPLLWIGEQLFFKGQILLHRSAPRTGTCYRPEFHRISFFSDENFGRRADLNQIPKFEIEKIRAGVNMPQGPIYRMWRELRPGMEALRQNYLKDITGQNVLPGLVDHLVILF